MMLRESRSPLTAAQVASQDAFRAWKEARRQNEQPRVAMGRSCVLCGGTASGESHRGFVGRCTCGVPSGVSA